MYPIKDMYQTFKNLVRIGNPIHTQQINNKYKNHAGYLYLNQFTAPHRDVRYHLKGSLKIIYIKLSIYFKFMMG